MIRFRSSRNTARVRALLDTHSFLWWESDEDRLSKSAFDIIRDGRNELLVSVATIWEVAIKYAEGRLVLPTAPDLFIAERLRRNRWTELPIDRLHAIRAGSLPRLHGDPFDRMLIAQAQIERLTIVTRDAAFDAYDVDVLRC